MPFYSHASYTVWDNQTLAVGTHYSSWLQLIEDRHAHSVNGKFVSTNSVGKLKLRYQLASMPDVDYAVDQGTVFAPQTDTGSPFLKTMQLRPSYYIRFVAEVTMDSLTGCTIIFNQTGKGS